MCRTIRETDLITAICVQMDWEKFDEERFETMGPDPFEELLIKYCNNIARMESRQLSRDAKNENSVSQGENGVLTRIQKSSGYSPEA